ncbi:MAG: MaoC family dehydratase N-terminal domain-containing protein [Hyphomonadaceae bacterium]|nr:MaoC family dehydratase N-terminal domain-containing protein [Hyphomonadaceae bacterium]
MIRQPISPDLVGLEFPVCTQTWSSKDVMLYALGVGARPTADLDFIYEGRGPRVLPTYAVIPGGIALGGMMRAVEMRLEMLLHGEQSIELFRPLPAEASVAVTGRITEVWDKGKAAVLGVESLARDADGDLFRTHATLFVRGAGGFGGERGPSVGDGDTVPDRAPDIEARFETRPEQGAIYRLSGDRNPIHIDPVFARTGGFDTPFMHGLCTYGIVGRAVLRELCADNPAAFRSFSGRFAERVMYGDTIVTKIWRTDDGQAIVRGETGDGRVVLSQSKANFSV